jgi:hypothetical protein
LKTILPALAAFFALAVVCPAAASENPPAPGFDIAGSDAQAIAVADAVMERLGGRDSWDQTRFLTWRFFGKRRHVWDKWTGDIRYESGDLLVLMNIHTRRGRAWQNGAEIVDADTLAARLRHGYEAWINDSYWVFMPFKLKDSGVTLKYKEKGQTEDGRAADVLVLTFREVGVTPQNKYEVWVDEETRLVTQWAFYTKAADAEPRFVNPWANWQQYGRIWLSDDRGRRKHTEIAVFDELPPSVFTRPEPVDVTSLVR